MLRRYAHRLHCAVPEAAALAELGRDAAGWREMLLTPDHVAVQGFKRSEGEMQGTEQRATGSRPCSCRKGRGSKGRGAHTGGRWGGELLGLHDPLAQAEAQEEHWGALPTNTCTGRGTRRALGCPPNICSGLWQQRVPLAAWLSSCRVAGRPAW